MMQEDTSQRRRESFTGTGGNGHAGEYYGENKYPLVVKMGTISPAGADVYSYPEDDMVLVWIDVGDKCLWMWGVCVRVGLSLVCIFLLVVDPSPGEDRIRR